MRNVARNVVVDAGPIIALMIAGDARHGWAREQFSRLRPPLLTCEPVLSEAAFVLERLGGDASATLALVDKGVMRVAFSVQEHAATLHALMRRYAGVPMSLADACLVRMTELIEDPAVMTFDSDFRVYRRRGRQVIPLLAPEDV